MLSVYRNSRPVPTRYITTSEATPPKKTPQANSHPCIQHTALAIGTTLESGIALLLTNQRFHIQSNKINGTTHKLQNNALSRGYEFFPALRFVQFSVMVKAKEWGITTAQDIHPTNKTAHDISGAVCSSLAALPFNYPMEWVLLQGVRASHLNVPFSINSTWKSLFREANHFQLRGMTPTLFRDLPFGGMAITLPGYFEKKLHNWVGEHISTSHIKTVATLMASAIFCVGTQPADVVKTAIQHDLKLPNRFGTVLKKIHTERGLSALFSGLTTRYPKVAATFLILNNLIASIETWMTGKRVPALS